MGVAVRKAILMMLLAGVSSSAAAQVVSGTAFAVTPGLLVTNQHVVAGCTSVEVVSPDGRRAGSVVDADDQIDLALLRVSGLKGATARLRNPRNVRLGESVMVFGFPLAGSLTSGGNFTSGLVSGLRGLRDAAGELQITAPVQPGNSGGPLMDASGLVIGVVQAKLDALRSAISTGDIPQNVNFAISLEVLAEFLDKNGVAFRNAALSAPLDTARVAEAAQSFTHRVECRGRSQQAVAPREVPKPPMATDPEKPLTIAPPSVEQGPMPGCPGSYDAATWTNCYGETRFPSDSMYWGEFKDGKPNGRGTLWNPDGYKYSGDFVDGKLHGRGTRYGDGKIIRGIWENGKFVGGQ